MCYSVQEFMAFTCSLIVERSACGSRSSVTEKGECGWLWRNCSCGSNAVVSILSVMGCLRRCHNYCHATATTVLQLKFCWIYANPRTCDYTAYTYVSHRLQPCVEVCQLSLSVWFQFSVDLQSTCVMPTCGTMVSALWWSLTSSIHKGLPSHL